MNPLVSVVMLSWNRLGDVKESLTKLMEQEYQPLEIIVVDNASSDGTAEMVTMLFPEVTLIQMEKNVGIAAYNVGFEKASGEYILILDDDSFPAKNAINRMVTKFLADDRLGIVAFDVRNYEAYDQVSEETGYSGSAQPDSYLMSFNGAGAGIRKAVFQKVGYYPEEFFLYQNELDVALKVHDSGYSVHFFPDVVAYHKYSPINRSSWRAPFFYTRNAFWILWKHYPLRLSIKYTVELTYKCMYHSFEQRTWVYIKALIAAYKDVNKLKGKRTPVKANVADRMRAPLDINFTFYR